MNNENAKNFNSLNRIRSIHFDLEHFILAYFMVSSISISGLTEGSYLSEMIEILEAGSIY